MSAFVLDASVTLAWAFDEADQPGAQRALDRINESGACSPSIWWYEVRNGLVLGERRARLDPVRSSAFLGRLSRFPVEVYPTGGSEELLMLARSHRLTAYDAAYLELALRLGAPLATLDQRLAEAARAAGISLL